MSNTKQADGEIHEDQLLNFLVNALDEEVALTLAEDARLNIEDIAKVPSAAAAADSDSSPSIRP